MTTPTVTTTARASSEPQQVDRFRLRGRWLWVARLAWLLISLSATGLLITALAWNTVA